MKADNYLPFYYGETLNGDIAFEDFFNLTQKRLNLLKKIEGFDFEMESKDKTFQINTELRTQGLDGRLSKQEQKNDILSHYFLRIAYSKTKDLRDWFVRQELIVFRARLSQTVTSSANPAPMIVSELQAIKAKFGDSFCPFELVISPAENHPDVRELKKYEEYLTEKGFNLREGFIKVPFEYIPKLVACRDVVIRKGTGYLPFKEGGVLLLETFFKRNLEDVTKKAKKILPLLEEMNGLFADYLQNIDNLLFNTKDFTKISLQRHSTINLADLDAHSNSNYPLCMRQMHVQVKQAHHLKHTGRLQYGLFLKGIGLTLDDSIKFWRQEFTKKIPKEQFDRNYLYNVRHSYGKEGKRADYTPWSCSRIILSSAPGKGEIHGCPFKDYNEHNLKRLLSEFKITGQQVDEILEKKRGNHFQMSCKLFFMATHPQAKELEGVGVHPNSYFEASFAFYSQGNDRNSKFSRNGSAYKGNNNFTQNQTQNQTQPTTQAQTQAQTPTQTPVRGQLSFS